MTLFAVHVLKDKTKAFNNPLSEVVVVEARDQAEVIKLVASYQFPEPWWKSGVSRCAIVKIIPLDSTLVIRAPKRVVTRTRKVK